MNEKRTAQLQRMFGTLWTELMKSSDHVGAFVLWHGSHEFYTDDNALALLGMDRETLSFDALVNVLECAMSADETTAPAKVVVLPKNEEENMTAGFVIKKENTVPRDMEGVFPILTQSQLVEHMTAGGSDAFLMLVQLEHVDSGRDERAFVRSALEAIDKACPAGSYIAYHSGLKYWVFVSTGIKEPQEFAEGLQKSVSECTITDEFGVIISKGHSLTFTGGYVAFDAREHAAMKEFHYASFALYEAVSEGVGTISSFSSAIYELQKNDYRKVQNFFRVLDDNSFMYHFQPIVSASDGSIYAYEALMRTDRKFGLSPLQIIDMAAKYDRLYDIEHATMFNVLFQLSRNQSFFKKRKLFINAIPSSFLSDDDWTRLMGEYGELMEKVVIELTEQTDTSDENLNFLINRLREHKVEMAIDDYGTGYSNTSRLIRYDPRYIKLDHSLISGIDTNMKLRSIVSQLIDMMHSNGFMVLAEGIETAEEMRVLSGMHADLFQGFYISRPKPFFINEISEGIRSEIIRYHLEVQGSADKIYHAESEEKEVIEISTLIREKYTGIYISGRHVELRGDAEMSSVVMPITIKEDTECRLELRNVCIEAEPDNAALTLGSGSKLRLTVHGCNRLVKGGILVPERSELVLDGAGKLTILPESISCFGIGNEFDLTYGKITLLMTDELTITACGDNCVGIGGGRCDSEDGITFEAGAVEISCSGANSIGIGSVDGKGIVKLFNCYLSVVAASANFVGVGSFSGGTDIAVDNVKLVLAANGNSMCAVGSKLGGRAVIDIKHCELNSNIKGREIVNIGSHAGECDCRIANSGISLTCEGSMASGIGDCEGGGLVDIHDSEIIIDFLTGSSYTLGCRDGELNFVGGVKTIRINEQSADI
ncbi:EAL domain-containing protein [Ruminococcus sp.]|uniref:EAL domain-containing protein n=1 Tax=Ruminococcus sp. TaxID=41978 RepID=UPI0025EF0001|nr:EAL domain-containing protein [Ruminococcus sp.]MBQ8966294.1 EAL domain-containing protein [Ruminococcus sp.]